MVEAASGVLKDIYNSANAPCLSLPSNPACCSKRDLMQGTGRRRQQLCTRSINRPETAADSHHQRPYPTAAAPAALCSGQALQPHLSRLQPIIGSPLPQPNMLLHSYFWLTLLLLLLLLRAPVHPNSLRATSAVNADVVAAETKLTILLDRKGRPEICITSGPGFPVSLSFLRS